MNTDCRSIQLKVNGKVYSVVVEPRKHLADVLREDCGLTGTHVGCEHGVCGACTVRIDGRTVRSCLIFAVQADGAEITTVEGLAPEGGLHPLQEAFIEEFGFQCGFCTSGMLMTCCELLERRPNPSIPEIKEAISGNICRCTGYNDIVRSVQRAAAKMSDSRKVRAGEGRGITR